MNQMCGEFKKHDRRNERGEGSGKLIIVLVILFLAVWAGYNYIPVAYNAQAYRQEMDTAVIQVMAMPGAMQNPVAWTSERLKRVGTEYSIPEDAVYDVKQLPNGTGVQAQVKYKKSVSLLPFYTYQYEFDYTAKTGGFMTK
jgi:hypothetical protein